MTLKSYAKVICHLMMFVGRALQAVDDALSSAAEVKNQKSEVVDKNFETAIEKLSLYEEAYHPPPKDPKSDDSRAKTVRGRMEEATTKDKRSSGILNTLKEKLRMKVRITHLPLYVVLMPTHSRL